MSARKVGMARRKHGAVVWGVADFFKILLEICGGCKKIKSLKKLWDP